MKERIFLSGLVEGFNMLQSEAKNKFLNLDNEKLNFKISPEKWSIAECLDHVISLDKLYIPAIKSALEKNEKDEYNLNEFTNSFMGKFVLGMFKPEAKFKVKTPQKFQSSKSNYDSSIVDDFIDQKKEMIELIEEAKRYEVSRIKITSPTIKLLRMNAGEMFMFLYIHDKRHINQAANVLKVINSGKV